LNKTFKNKQNFLEDVELGGWPQDMVGVHYVGDADSRLPALYNFCSKLPVKFYGKILDKELY
jgi:hypothetical protein